MSGAAVAEAEEEEEECGADGGRVSVDGVGCPICGGGGAIERRRGTRREREQEEGTGVTGKQRRCDRTGSGEQERDKMRRGDDPLAMLLCRCRVGLDSHSSAIVCVTVRWSLSPCQHLAAPFQSLNYTPRTGPAIHPSLPSIV